MIEINSSEFFRFSIFKGKNNSILLFLIYLILILSFYSIYEQKLRFLLSVKRLIDHDILLSQRTATMLLQSRKNYPRERELAITESIVRIPLGTGNNQAAIPLKKTIGIQPNKEKSCDENSLKIHVMYIKKSYIRISIL